jgi:signal transduction histidine kinase
MQWLPEVVTTHGTFALPLFASTSRRLAAGLVSGEGYRPNRSRLAEALARDPALLLWAVFKSHASRSAPLGTIDTLAEWLAVEALDTWSQPAQGASSDVSDRETLKHWASLTLRSICAARRAAEVAQDARIDRDDAYLLGMLHLAPQWLKAARCAVGPQSVALPAWLQSELERIGNASPGDIATAADCVAMALRDVSPDGEGDDQKIAAMCDGWLRDDDPDLLINLAARLRRLRDLEEHFERTLEAEKLESLKELAYGAGHEINNPLANISARAQTLLQDERDPERRRMLASINAQAFRAHEMIADMMLYARPPRPKAEPFDMARLVADLYEELARQSAAQQTQLVLSVPQTPVTVTADKTQIAVALRSLCTNALEALVSGGRVEIVLAAPISDERSVRIRVADNGPGIPPEVRRHLFDPFYSGREAGRGLGLGLSKCWRIITMHDGHVEVASADGRGAVFTVTLPIRNGR